MSQWFICASVAAMAVLSEPVNAQTADFHGPTAGFVFCSDSRTVRPLLGIPGSASVGSPLVSDVDKASIAPGGKWALITKAERSIFVRGLSDLAPSEFSAEGLIDSIDRVVWNRDGSAALLYSSSGRQLQRASLSGSAVLLDTPVDLGIPGHVTTLAIDPSGRQIALGVAGSDSAGIYLFPAGQSPALLSSMAQPAATAFDGTGRHLYTVDLAEQRILDFDAVSSEFQFTSLAQPDGLAPDPAGLAVSGDGRYLLLADRTTRAVQVYETASRSLASTIPLDFAPSRFEALSRGPDFLLNGDRGDQWLLILDARLIPGVYFVPASQKEPL